MNGAHAAGRRANANTRACAQCTCSSCKREPGNAPHNVPRPPSAGGTLNSQVAARSQRTCSVESGVTTLCLGLAGNQSYARGNSNLNNHCTANSVHAAATREQRRRTTRRYHVRPLTTPITRPAERPAVGSIASVGALATCVRRRAILRQRQLARQSVLRQLRALWRRHGRPLVTPITQRQRTPALRRTPRARSGISAYGGKPELVIRSSSVLRLPAGAMDRVRPT